MSKERDYSMEGLIKTFGEHADLVEKIPVAENMKDGDFNFPRALQAICKEIAHLKIITDLG